MSLQVWLPLNKKVVNAGLGNVNVINNGVTISDNGILGKCGSFTPGQYIEFTNVPFSKLNNCSVSFWIKLDANEGKWLPLSGQGEPYYILAWQSESYNNGNFYSMNAGSNHKIYVDGVQSNKPIRDGNWHHYCIVGANFSSWTKFYVNRYYNESNVYNFTGLLNDFRIYDYALSAADVLRIYQNKNIYEIPISLDTPTPSLPLWIKVLHHNVPSSNRFTTANCMKNTKDNLYSRLGIYFNSTIFKRWNDKYEFLANEKLESGSTEQNYQWRQLSNPTASTITGFESIKNTSNSSYLVGLKHNGNYSVFHNGDTWWCACGCYSVYQGGIPGFGNVIKSGYLDLYAKAKIGHLPKDYEELDYITFNGTHYFYIDKPQGQKSSMKIEFYIEPDTLDHSQPTFFGGVNSGVQFYRPNATNLKLSTSSGSMGFGTFNAGQKNSLIVDLTASSVKSRLNGRAEVTTTNTDAFNKLFSQSCTKFTVGAYNLNSYPFYGNLYELKIYTDNVLLFSGIPSKRKSDGAVGMYDLVTKKLFTNQGTGNFVEGPVVFKLPSEYEEMEYIEGTGTQWIDVGVKANQDTKAEIKFEITGNAPGYGAVFGSRTSYNNNAFNVWSKCGNGNIGANYCKAGAINSTIAQAANVTYYITLEKNKLSVNGNVTTFTQNTNFTTPGNIYLFNIYGGDAISTGTSNRILIGKVYSFKLYNSDIIIRNMIPSKRKSDNVIGMYDIVSGQFFTNSGTGSFTVA